MPVIMPIKYYNVHDVVKNEKIKSAMVSHERIGSQISNKSILDSVSNSQLKGLNVSTFELLHNGGV